MISKILLSPNPNLELILSHHHGQIHQWSIVVIARQMIVKFLLIFNHFCKFSMQQDLGTSRTQNP